MKVGSAHGARKNAIGFGELPLAGQTVVDLNLVNNLISSKTLHDISGTVGVIENNCYFMVRKSDGLNVLCAVFVEKFGYKAFGRDLKIAEKMMKLPMRPTTEAIQMTGANIRPIYNRGYQLMAIEMSSQKTGSSTTDVIVNNQRSEFKDLAELGRDIPRTWTPHHRTRALAALKAIAALGYPTDKVMCDMADGGELKNCDFTSQDVRNSTLMFGPNVVHLEGTCNAKPALPSTRQPAETIGEHVAMDPKKFKSPTIGGGNQAYISVDEMSEYVVIVIEPSKTVECTKDAESTIVAHYNQFGWRVKRFSTDHESTLVASQKHLNEVGIVFDQTVPGRHQTLVERAIQTLAKLSQTIKASHNYHLPENLNGELMQHCAMLMNMRPNVKTFPHSPQYLVEGVQPTIPRYAWGITGIFQRKNEVTGARTVTGILVGYDNPDMNRIRAFLPSTNRIVVVLAPQLVLKDPLPEWEFKPKYEARPNANLARKAAESGTPVPVNQNFKIQGSPPISTLDEVTESKANDAVVKERVTPLLIGVETRDIPMVHTRQSIDRELADDLPLRAIESVEPTSVTAETSYNPITMLIPSSTRDIERTVLQQQIPAIRSSSRIPVEKRKGYSQFRFADPESDRANSRYYSCGGISSVPLVHANQVSLQRGLKSDRSADAKAAGIAEIVNMLKTHQALKGIHYYDIPSEHKSRVMMLHMFLKDKSDPAGHYLKMKGRLIIGGNIQDPTTYSSIASPTANPITIMLLVHLLAVFDRECATMDVPAAFLTPPMEDDVHFYGMMDPTTARLAVEVDPSLAQYLSRDGRLYFRLMKYLYGLHQASMVFYKFLVAYFLSKGLTQSAMDPCLFYLNTPEGQVNLVFHVDDIFLTAPTKRLLNKYVTMFKTDLNIETQTESPYSFIGMTLTRDRSSKSVKITMGALTAKLIDTYAKDKKIAVTPSTKGLVDPPYGSNLKHLDPAKLSEFVTIVMTLLFIARFVRPDILFSVTILATRLKDATHNDLSEAIRILRYLNGTRDVGLIFKGAAKAVLEFFVDASHGLINGRGIGAFLATLGSATVLCKCWFLKWITLSSAESEVCALTESVTYVLWMREVYAELGHAQTQPTPVHQDNEAAVRMQTAGTGSFKRSKHLLAKAAFCKQEIDNRTIVPVRTGTELMLCDMITKVLNGPAMRVNMEGASMG